MEYSVEFDVSNITLRPLLIIVFLHRIDTLHKINLRPSMCMSYNRTRVSEMIAFQISVEAYILHESPKMC